MLKLVLSKITLKQSGIKMSSDYLNDVEDSKGTVVLLTMSVSGYAELTTMEADKVEEPILLGDQTEEGEIARFCLIPDENGWNNANKIADALKEWVSHTKRIAVD